MNPLGSTVRLGTAFAQERFEQGYYARGVGRLGRLIKQGLPRLAAQRSDLPQPGMKGRGLR